MNNYEGNRERAPRQRKQLKDKTLLLVRGSFGNKAQDTDYVKSVANAIDKVLGKFGLAKTRSIGAGSISNAVKAISIVVDAAEKNGIELIVKPKFVEIEDEDFEDKVEMTGILLVIEKRYPDKKEEATQEEENPQKLYDNKRDVQEYEDNKGE